MKLLLCTRDASNNANNACLQKRLKNLGVEKNRERTVMGQQRRAPRDNGTDDSNAMPAPSPSRANVTRNKSTGRAVSHRPRAAPADYQRPSGQINGTDTSRLGCRTRGRRARGRRATGAVVAGAFARGCEQRLRVPVWAC